MIFIQHVSSTRLGRRYQDHLVGPLLESHTKRSFATGKISTHYRPRQSLREAAQQMLFSKGDGINLV
jgi:hypothetical protein